MVCFVKNEDLQNVKILNTIHIWQVLEGKKKSLANSTKIRKMESQTGFIEKIFWDDWLTKYNGKLPNGFYWIDHHSKTSNVVLSNTWTAAEYQLKQKGIVFSEP